MFGLRKLQIFSIFLALCSIFALRLKDPYYGFSGGMWGQDTIEKRKVPLADQMSEKDATEAYQGIAAERETLLRSGGMTLEVNHELQGRVYNVMYRTVTEYDIPGARYECDQECEPKVHWPARELLSKLSSDIWGQCDGRFDECAQLARKYFPDVINHPKEVKVRNEVVNQYGYKVSCALAFLLLSLFCLALDRGMQFGWAFERMVGGRLIKCAVYSALFAFSFCGGAAIAQQISQKTEQQRQKTERVIDGDQQKNPENGSPDNFTVIGFTDATRDSQLIAEYDFSRGPVLFEQLRRTTDGLSVSNLAAAGWKFSLGRFGSVAAVAGPSFDPVKGKYSGTTQILPFANIKLPFGSFVLFNKLFLNTDSGELTGSRHIVVGRPPPARTPKLLRGLQWRSEMWHQNGKWVEQLHGVEFNPAQMAGKPKSFWASFAIWPYWDFTRPQPGHPHRLDVRITYTRTFSLAH